MKKVIAFHQEQTAATTVEYAIMLALIVLVCIAAIISVGDEASGFWNRNVGELDSNLNR